MSSASTATQKPQESVREIDLLALLAELAEHWKCIAFVTALFTLVALLYALSATPLYQANALIQIEQKQGNVLLGSLSQMLPDSQPQSAPEITLLQSRMLLGQTVDALNLQTQIMPRQMPIVGKIMSKITASEPMEIKIAEFELPMTSTGSATATLKVISKHEYLLSGEGFEIAGQTGKPLQKEGVSLLVTAINAEPGSRFTLTRYTRLKAITDLQKAFSVQERGRDTGMLDLTMVGEDPELITAILNSISDSYLAQNIARQAAQDAKSLEFLDSQLPKIRSDLNSAEDKLNEYRKQKDSVDLNMEARSVLEQIVNADNQLNELTFREAEVSQLYKKDHPTYRALLEKRQTLQNEKVKLNKRISAMPATQQEVLRLSRDVDSGRAVYLQLLNRQQELNVAKSSAIGNVRIIDDAITLPSPVKPKKALIVLVGMMMGGAFSVAGILLKAALHQGLESPEQLEEGGISVYACVPYSEWLGKHSGRSKKSTPDILLATQNPADIAIETIRGLRTSLHFTMMDARNNLLMISGVSPGSGKTFISSNLATVVAQTQKRVLLIDADMRKGYLHQLFGVEETPGLSDILNGKATFAQTVVTLPEADIDFITRGHTPSNPAELLMSPGFKSLLDEVSPLYDLVIIDTPPAMAVTDATVVGRYTGTVLMVARFEDNTAKEVIASTRRFEQDGVSVEGWILNGIRKKTSGYYAYGYSPHPYAYHDKK
ncbi:polysaccharide biosynthesis tyrosine autokinase [Scandinavium sp.]|uniref:polysaccharide biosynthesis tyrosine autokinase n=1 Tax=Scandinavium sp. TaxID=2830653 RepID=UPI002896A55D|nr:polysaccharide biosynthesis tyrosine autokinase [Scandinavium sp.]